MDTGHYTRAPERGLRKFPSSGSTRMTEGEDAAALPLPDRPKAAYKPSSVTPSPKRRGGRSSIWVPPCGGTPATYLSDDSSGPLYPLRVLDAFGLAPRRDCRVSPSAGYPAETRLCGSNPHPSGTDGPAFRGVRCPMELGLSSLRPCLRRRATIRRPSVKRSSVQTTPARATSPLHRPVGQLPRCPPDRYARRCTTRNPDVTLESDHGRAAACRRGFYTRH